MDKIIRIKDLSDGACKCIRSIDKYKPYTKDCEHQQAICARIFKDLNSGKVNTVSLISDTQFLCYHRSPKNDGAVQLSAGMLVNGKFDAKISPSYDRQLYSGQDIYDEGIEPGYWKIA